MKDKLWMLLTWLWLLALAVTLTIYGAWLIYPLEVDWLHLLTQVTISKHQLLENFNILMTYLTNPFKTVLSMPDFASSESGLKHFSDVKHLFQFAQAVVIVLLAPSYLFLKRHHKERSLFMYQRAFIIASLIPIMIAIVGFLIGFDNFFTLFHECLFPGDSSWLFNPYTDPIIWVLPEEYFLHCFILFFALYECFMLALIVTGRMQLRKRTASLKEEQIK